MHTFRVEPKSNVTASTSVPEEVVTAVEEELSETFEDNIVPRISLRLSSDLDQFGLDDMSPKGQAAIARYQKARREYIEAVADMITIW